MDFELAAGTVIGADFRVLSPLAQGGMGAVYVAEQLSTGRQRALKVLRRDLLGAPGMAERFALEARVAARIRSDHVVEVVAAGVDPALGLAYLAMELLEGQSLDAILKQRGGLPPHEALALLWPIGVGLAAAHEVGVVHRDLKPENVFVAIQRDSSRSTRVKILDFGIAKIVSEATAAAPATMALGTPRWMSPEQTETGARVSPATDVWAFGLVAYFTLTGCYFWRSSRPEGGGVGQLLREILSDPIPPASVRAAEQGVRFPLPPGFDAWLARCLEREQARRFPSGREACEALRVVLEGGHASSAQTGPTGGYTPYASPAPPPTPPRAAKGGRGVAIAVLSILGTLALLVSGLLVAHFGFDAFDLDERSAPPPPTTPTPEVAIEGQWAIAEGRSPQGISYSGESIITRSGEVRFQDWNVNGNRGASGYGLLDGNEYSVAWGQSPFGLYVYRIAGGRLTGRVVVSTASTIVQTETLDGPPSLLGTFRIVASTSVRSGTMTFRLDGSRYLVTRQTEVGVLSGVGIKDGDRLVVALSAGGRPTGAYAFRLDGPDALVGSWTDTTEPGVGRELLAKRSAPIDPGH